MRSPQEQPALTKTNTVTLTMVARYACARKNNLHSQEQPALERTTCTRKSNLHSQEGNKQ
jgi:hypothetical protein